MLECPERMGPIEVFVDLSRSQGINSQPGGPVRQAYLTYLPARPGLLKRLQIRAYSLPKLVPVNRFLGSLNVYKSGLWAG
jgi:hypothetical protein